MKRIALFVLLLCGIVAAQDVIEDKVITMYLVNQDPDPVIAGDDVDIRIGIRNEGTEDVESLSVSIVESSAFDAGEGTVDAGEVLGFQGYLDSEDSKIVKFNLQVARDAHAGTHELKVKAYSGTELLAQSSFAIDIKSREAAEVIHIDRSVLVPGQISPLRFTINNVGNSPITDISFNWQNEDNVILPVGSDNTRYIRRIEVGESEDVEYNVIADTNSVAGLYPLDLQLTYHDSINNAEKVVSTVAGIYVGGKTDFDVSFSETSSGQTSFTVANIGSNPATSVSVLVPNQQGWSVSGSNTMIIGNLAKGDYTVASFKLSSMGVMNRTARNDPGVPSQKSGTGLKIAIAYTDTTGTRQVVEKQVELSPASLGNSTVLFQRGMQQRQSSTSGYLWYLAAAIALVAAFIGYRHYRKKKMFDPDFRVKDILRKKR